MTSEKALNLEEIAETLGALGRVSEALELSQQAVTTWRALAVDAPRRQTPDLARSLGRLAGLLRRAGRFDEAQSAAEEGVAQLRELATERPDLHLPYLARTLGVLADVRRSTGHAEEAVSVAMEVVELLRQLAAERPAPFAADLADALDRLSAQLADLGRVEESVQAAQEAVSIFRGLASERPQAHRDQLGASLEQLGLALSRAGRVEEAHQALAEVLSFRRAAAETDRSELSLELARSLQNLATVKARLGQREAALAASEEAVTIFRLAQGNRPGVLVSDLASALSNLGNQLLEVGRTAEAMAVSEEAVSILRAVVSQVPSPLSPVLAAVLLNLSVIQRQAGRARSGLVTAREAVELYRRLVAAGRALGADLARALHTLSMTLRDLGNEREALALSKEAVELLRPAFIQHPQIHEAQMEAILKNHRELLDRFADESPVLASSHGAGGSHGRLQLSIRRWRFEMSPPGALLRPDYCAVPFHGRERELGDLLSWATNERPVAIRLFTGAGGMGKTRLAIEACLRMRRAGWEAGFMPADTTPPAEFVDAFLRQPGPLLIVVDYAETRRDLLANLLRQVRTRQGSPTRVLLLARAALDWWEALKGEAGGVGELLTSAATSRSALAPLANSVEARARSYRLAAEAFAAELGKEPPAEFPDHLEAGHFERALLLHMTALAAIEGVVVKGEEGILDFVLEREVRFWRERARLKALPEAVTPGIGRALAAITLGGGVRTEDEAVEVLRRLTFFADEEESILTSVAHLLHELYRGTTSKRYIEPILPDLLGEHLVQRELEKGADEMLDLVLGPRRM